MMKMIWGNIIYKIINFIKSIFWSPKRIQIFFRHAFKQYNDDWRIIPNQPLPRLDPPIEKNDDHISFMALLGDKVGKKYGIPDKIYCSPFTRTRETASFYVKHFNLDSSPEVLQIISEKTAKDRRPINFLDGDLSLHEDGIKPTEPESGSQFKHRVKDFLRFHIHGLPYHKIKSSSVHWYITHGKFLKRLLKLQDEIPKKLYKDGIECLDGVVFINGQFDSIIRIRNGELIIKNVPD